MVTGGDIVKNPSKDIDNKSNVHSDNKISYARKLEHISLNHDQNRIDMTSFCKE